MPTTRETRSSTTNKSPGGLGDALTDAEVNFYDSTTEESDVSQYGKKGKKKTKKPTRKLAIPKRRRSPTPPPMSDMDYESDSPFTSPEIGDVIEVKRPGTATTSIKSINEQSNRERTGSALTTDPTILQFHLDCGAAQGGTTINVDLSDLLNRKHDYLETLSSEIEQVSPPKTIINNRTYNRSVTSGPPSKRARLLKGAENTAQSIRQSKTGFSDLPYELRIRVYRQVFVTETPIDFESRKGFARSSAFLRTCHLTHDEGRAVLYGENAFHFERCHGARGAFYEPVWKEIGFKDARRFLETIGTDNISKMKYISFQFLDGAPSATPYFDEEERRYVNDPILHHILKTLGSYARLSKIAFTFQGRRQLLKTDVSFLQALSTIKSEEVIHADHMSYPYSKARQGVVDKLQRVMTVRRNNEEVDPGKKKAPTVRMFHEKPKPSSYYGGRW